MDNVELVFRSHQKHPPNDHAFYRLSNGRIPWGDYGLTLVHGGYDRSPDDPAVWGLHRPGPFIPPIFFLGSLVATDESKRLFSSSGLSGFTFSPIAVVKAINIPWHTWDLQAGEPEVVPEDGEPEGYLEDWPHDEELMKRFGRFWRMEITEGAKELRVPREGNKWNPHIYIRADTWNGDDFFRADTTKYTYISARAFDWMRNHLEAWFGVTPVETR